MKELRSIKVFLLIAFLVFGESILSSEAKSENSLRSPHIKTDVLNGAVTETTASMSGTIVRSKKIDVDKGNINESAKFNGEDFSIDHEKIKRLDNASWAESHGGISPRLFNLFQQDPTALRLVDIVGVSREFIPNIIQEIRNHGIQFISKHQNVVTVRTNLIQLKTFANHADIALLTKHYPRENLSINAAKDLGQTELSLSHQVGVGVGFLSVVWEKEACVNREHPDFSLVDWQSRIPETCTESQAGHSTKVAGVLAAFRGQGETSGMFRGKMLDVNALSDQAEDYMWSLSPQIVNASFTISPADGQRIDEEVYRNGVFVFNGAGNDRDDEANCYAYNALCIGGYDHAGTIQEFTDDVQWLGQSFINDDETGREAPHLVGPVAVTSAARSGGYVSDRGTSYATPAVAGLAGLLLTHQPFLLWKKPALMRAILMASAHKHPIGDVTPSIPDFDDEIDDTSGVGAPEGETARRIVDDHSFLYRILKPEDMGEVISFSVEGGRAYRVVLAWDQCPTYSPYGYPEPNELKVDLDMAVRLVTQGVEGLSASILLGIVANPSFRDNWEIVEFTPLISGTAEIILSASKFQECELDEGRTEVRTAVAWTSKPDNSATVLEEPSIRQ